MPYSKTKQVFRVFKIHQVNLLKHKLGCLQTVNSDSKHMANLNCLRTNFTFAFPNVCQSLLGSKYMCEWVEFNKMKLFSNFLEQVNCFHFVSHL